MPFDTSQDSRALTCSGVQWERIGPAAPPLPNGLWTAYGSTRFFNLGRRTWLLVEKNKPVTQALWASACPADTAPGSGSIVQTQEFSVRAKNYYGVPVVTIRYRFGVQSGSETGASDRWIGQLSVAPGELSVASGWNVSMTVFAQEPREYPDAGATIAVLPVQIDLALETKMKRHDASKMHLAVPAGVFFA